MMNNKALNDSIWQEDLNLAKHCWFGCAGNAERAYFPTNDNDLIKVLNGLVKDKISYTVLGAGSNVLIRETGLKGVTIIFGKSYANIDDSCSDVINVKAGALCANVALSAVKKGISGMEFMVGIPGTIGGAIKMNAGCHGSEMANIIHEVTIWTPELEKHVLFRSDLKMNYRSCHMDNGAVILSAKLTGNKDRIESIRQRTHVNKQQRKHTQPIIKGTGGSTFKNPFGPDKEPKAWQLIEKSNCRGMDFQGAQVSIKHCNFLINKSSATPLSIEVLGEYVRRKVKQDSNISLSWEIHRLGDLNDSLKQNIELCIKNLAKKY